MLHLTQVINKKWLDLIFHFLHAQYFDGLYHMQKLNLEELFFPFLTLLNDYRYDLKHLSFARNKPTDMLIIHFHLYI